MGATAPVANFSGTPRIGTKPLAVKFTDLSTNTPTSWKWDFNNDGTTDSTAQHPLYTYSFTGTYTVKLTATNAGGSDDEIKIDYIVVTAPAPKPKPAPACLPLGQPLKYALKTSLKREALNVRWICNYDWKEPRQDMSSRKRR